MKNEVKLSSSVIFLNYEIWPEEILVCSEIPRWILKLYWVTETREMGRNRKSASLITQSVLINSIENSFVLALIRSLEKVQKKTARHAKKAGFYMAMA